MTRAQKDRITVGVVANELRDLAARLSSASKTELDYSPDGIARAVGRLQAIANYEAERIQRLAVMLAEVAA